MCIRTIDQLINRRQATASIHGVSAMSTAHGDRERRETHPAVSRIGGLSGFALVAFHLDKGRFSTKEAGMVSQEESLHNAVCQPLHGALPGGSERVETGK